jgi:predicted transcriptional regulator
MEIFLAPAVEQKLSRIASEVGKTASQIVQELVVDYLDHDGFRREVQKGLASLDSGRFAAKTRPASTRSAVN